jgi:hypothetical protein
MKVLIPTDQSEITLRQFVKCMAISQDEDMSELEKGKLIVSEIIGVPHKDLDKVSAEQLDRLSMEVSQVLFMQQSELVNTFELNGVQYGKIPNFQDCSFGELVDLDTFCSKGFYENLHRIMGIIYRPIKERRGELYSVEDYEPNDGSHFKELGLHIVSGMIVFFYNLGKQLLEISQRCSKGMGEKERVLI